MVEEFEVIEIMDDNNPYLDLIRLDKDFDMDAIILMKIKSLVFEKNGTRVIFPLDPFEGARYKKLVCDEYCDEENDNIYIS